ncbi:MAG: hypothetical protein QF921_14785 [Pseudomonadales bacterium]|jgi:hypothetical protein|nr:hypothetical protein [Pseudomonadales bacterium]MDP6469707.1 hypothetical protein [Pseudomonadales bacterium]MDP6828948.1 hypothetical protein [Pseudomonadales bacterium]MDP6972748.1 hypothetical protein [Pseudomonadales bacterium]|tara:strand:- start:5946 stop:6239 length:294 start_codon:yes stop_codon:yes gene_type:complete
MAANCESCPSATSGDEGFDIPADQTLVAEGWVRRYLADAERTEEAVELYTSLGFEVKTTQLAPAELGPQCTDCAAGVCASYRLIYTRAQVIGRPDTD